MVVSGVLVAIVVASFAFYDLSARRTSDAQARIDMEILANDVMDSLVRTNGVPGGWEDFPASASSYGLAGSPLDLSWRKVAAFSALGYQQSKDVMGIGSYDYVFSVKTLNETALVKSGQGPSSPKIAVNPRRTAVLNGTAVYVDFLLWR